MAGNRSANRRGKTNISRQKVNSLYEAAQRRAHAIAQEIVDEIANNPDTPEGETGRLRQSYRVDTDTNGDAVIRSSAPYWKYVEFGTEEHGGPQPHVRPAIELVRARHDL